jgi:hypothetical protein
MPISKPSRKKVQTRDPPPIDDDIDDRCAISAFSPYDDELNETATIPAAAGFMVLLLQFNAAQRPVSFSSWPVVAWRLMIDGDCPFPIVAGMITIKFHRMCDLAIRAPGGSVTGFDYGQYPSSAAWLRSRQRELRRRR